MAILCISGCKECNACGKCMERKVLGACEYCGEPIYEGETHYMLEDGTMLHDDCGMDWLNKYRKEI